MRERGRRRGKHPRRRIHRNPTQARRTKRTRRTRQIRQTRRTRSSSRKQTQRTRSSNPLKDNQELSGTKFSELFAKSLSYIIYIPRADEKYFVGFFRRSLSLFISFLRFFRNALLFRSARRTRFARAARAKGYRFYKLLLRLRV